ncbi:FAD-dependent oxidoreductase [Paucihalobacter ruber]|uniref:FAD-dependent oxidoreductase n=1 Tax=Paucihalobacter ruber TaxID=2567861 RepID=A0A506PBZ3_9FLAO|nr:NAD(P)/FAD-dependent oxidoreductase [Paucihalobacter ruber]TPV31481.1 FAD-dependent oxidoreductase [Paucihalobacter ruber]
MNKQDYKIHIIGAGISGLIAAQVLEKNGYRPIIIEASDRAGGRIKTDLVNSYQLDHGFQVLLDAYPKVKQYLNLDALEAQYFAPGAIIFKNGEKQIIGDGFRNKNLLWSTLLTNVATISDKLKILALNKSLRNTTIKDIFNKPEQTTLQYLKSKGFSDKVIEQFFKPFYSGIFLEPHLETSSRMFEFVFKMFGEGNAVLPKAGIGGVTNQLVKELKSTKILYNTKVKEVKDKVIVLENGEQLKTHFTIIATAAEHLIGNLNNQQTQWKSCDCLYFEIPEKPYKLPLIGLIADTDALINNLWLHNNLDVDSVGAQNLLSVTVVKSHNLKEDELVERVIKELKNYCKIDDAKFIKRFKIDKALPKLHDLRCDMAATETRIKPTIFLAGDYLLNASLNAAMTSGERAAEGVIAALEDGLFVEELTSEYI